MTYLPLWLSLWSLIGIIVAPWLDGRIPEWLVNVLGGPLLWLILLLNAAGL